MSSERGRCEAPTPRGCDGKCERKPGHEGEHGGRSMGEVMDDAREIERGYQVPTTEAGSGERDGLVWRLLPVDGRTLVMRRTEGGWITGSGIEQEIAVVPEADLLAVEAAHKERMGQLMVLAAARDAAQQDLREALNWLAEHVAGFGDPPTALAAEVEWDERVEALLRKHGRLSNPDQED